eukprot:Em0016g790a
MAEVKRLREGCCYVCPYSLRTNMHPFICILNARPECGIYIVSELQTLLTSRDRQFDILRALDPVIKYILLHPNPSPELASLSHHLHTSLVHTCHLLTTQDRALASAIASLLVHSFPLLQVSTDCQLISAATSVQSIIELVTQIKHPSGGVMCTAALSVCCECVQRGLVPVSLVRCIQTNHGVLSHLHHHFAIGWMLVRALPHPQLVSALLLLAEVMMADAPPMAQCLYVYPLVQLLSQSSSALAVLTGDTISSNQKAASRLLARISWNSEALCDGVGGGEEEEVEVCTPCCLHYSTLEVTAQVYRACCMSSEQCASRLRALVRGLKGGGASTPSAFSASGLDHLAMLLCGLCWWRGDGLAQAGAGLDDVLELFGCLANSDPTMSPSLLPCLLHLQSLPSCPDTVLAVLHSIPGLGTHPMVMGGVVHTLLFLAKTPALRPLAVRLLGKLWERQDGIFGKLKDLLVQPVSPSLPASVLKELELSHAVVIKDICCLRPEQHGEEVLTLVFSVFRASSDPIGQRMMIEGLVALCKAEVVDVVTLWSVLGGQLSALKSPIVVAAVCHLLAMGASVSVQKDSHRAFKATALQHLWTTLSSATRVQNYTICTGALEALGEFCCQDDLLKYIPREFCLRLGVPEEVLLSLPSNPDPEPLLDGRHYVALLRLVPELSLDQYKTFLGTRLAAEVKELPRGAVQMALREAGSVTPLDRDLSTAMKKVAKLTSKSNPYTTSASTDPDVGTVLPLGESTTPLVIRALRLGSALWVPASSGDSPDLRLLGRRVMEEEVTRCVSRLEELLRGNVGCPALLPETDDLLLSVFVCSRLVQQWTGFMAGVCQACMKAHLLKSATKEAYKMSYTELLSKITANAPCTPSALLAVVGMSVALGHVEVVWLEQLLCSLGCMLRCGVSGVTMETAPCDVGQLRKVSLIDCTITGGSWVHMWGQLMTGANHILLEPYVVLCLPSVVHAILCQSPVLCLTTRELLEAIILTLTEKFITSPQWYLATSLNQLLLLTHSYSFMAKAYFNKLLPYMDVAANGRSPQLLSLMTSFIPALSCNKQTHGMSLLSASIELLAIEDLRTVPLQMLAINVATSVAEMPTDVDVSTCLTALANAATRCPQAPAYHLSLAIAMHGLCARGHTGVVNTMEAIAAKWLQELSVGTSNDKRSIVSSSMTVRFTSMLFPLMMEKLDKEVTGNVSMMLEAREKVPLTYSYLSEGSILAALLSVLRDLTASPLVQSTVPLVRAALGVLGASMTSLPPVDFSDILLPICEYKELRTSAVSCFTKCCSSSVPSGPQTPPPGFSQFAHLCCSSHFFLTLSDSTALSTVLTGMTKSFQREGLVAPVRDVLADVARRLCAELREERCWSDVVHCPTLMECLAECVSYVEDRGELLSLADRGQPISSGVFNSILHSCLVKGGKQDIVALRPVLEWNLNTVGDGTNTNKLMPSLSWLLTTVHHCCSPQHVKNPLLNQTDLLHTLLCWTRAHQPSVEQMRLVFSLTSCIVMADVTSSPDLSSLLVVGGCVEHLLCELWNDPHISFAPQARLLKEKDNRAAKRQRYQEDLEENRAAKRQRYQEDLEENRAAKRQRYQEDLEENRAAKRQRYQEDLEENRAAKRQRYQEDLEENRAAKRQRYQEDLEENRAAKRQRYQEDLEEDRVLLKGSDIKRTSRRTVLLKGSDIKRTSRRTVLLKGSDIKRTSRRTVLLKGRSTRIMQLPLRHLKEVGIGMNSMLSYWLNVCHTRPVQT